MPMNKGLLGLHSADGAVDMRRRTTHLGGRQVPGSGEQGRGPLPTVRSQDQMSQDLGDNAK